MLRLKAERRSLAKVSGASASESLTKTPDVAHFTTGAPVSSVTPRIDPLAPARGIVYGLIFSAIAVAVIVGGWSAVGFLLTHPAYFFAFLGFAVLAIIAGARKEGLL